MAKFLDRLLEVVMILGILYLASGCSTLKGGLEDISYLSGTAAQNIQTK